MKSNQAFISFKRFNNNKIADREIVFLLALTNVFNENHVITQLPW